jgi:hypothetical protein
MLRTYKDGSRKAQAHFLPEDCLEVVLEDAMQLVGLARRQAEGPIAKLHGQPGISLVEVMQR